MTNLLVDANIIIRFLTNDDNIQSPAAYQVFKKAVDGELHLVLSPIIIAECTWVLQMKRYGYTKKEIADKFTKMILSPGIKTFDKDIILKALIDYSVHNVDFIDAYLSATSILGESNLQILTWNQKHFKRLGCEFYTPEELQS